MKHLICSSVGHQLTTSKKITGHISEYRCKRCNAEFTLNGKGHIVPLNSKLKEINLTLEKMYNRKLKKYHKIT